MEILNIIIDYFDTIVIYLSPNKKLKNLSKEFKNSFNLTLVFYQGNMVLEETLTIADLNFKKNTHEYSRSQKELKIRSSMKVGHVEELFSKTLRVTVQIKNNNNMGVIDNKISIGDAERAEKYLLEIK